ncbi:YjbH domain-containing protein [Aeromonas jandaei]|uniref:YjbH domain-containing protein n=1 Tax=Aeromonas jandaei TaxID=650 RepID=UPI0036709A62
MMIPRVTFIALFVSGVVHAASYVNDPYGPSQSDFGGVGLMQMPTARMAKVGEFSANYFDNDQYRRWSISVQPFDWFEATLRYTDVRTQLYSQNEDFSGEQTYKDKGIDFKLRLVQESKWVPQVSLGFRDLMGTGLFDSEYIAGSKRYGPFDFTLGLGWGNMAEGGNIKNPFCWYKEGWCKRNEALSSGSTGKFEVDSFFHGDVAFFGGVEYQTSWEPLRLKIEYDGNDYSHEFAGEIARNSPWNFGAVYRVFDNLDTHLNWQRGNTLMWGITLRTNFNELKPAQTDVPRPKYQASNVPDTVMHVDWRQFASELNRNAGWKDAIIYQDGAAVTILAEQTKYRNREESTARTGLLAVNYLPESVRKVQLIEKKAEFKLQETAIDLPSVRSANVTQILGQEHEAQFHTSASNKKIEDKKKVFQAPKDRITYSLDPDLNQSFGGPESFYMYQFGINGNATWHFSERLSLDSTVFLNVVNNYDKFNYKTPPVDGEALPRVRTWIREYVDSSDVLLNNLQLTNMQQISADWYGQIYGGYLEMMYAGVGGEALYRPYGKSWAVGIDTNWVKQRDWYNTLKMAEYDVVTGHLTGYWQWPYLDNVMVKIAVGRYLAGDMGATFDFSKRFDSGIMLGAYATLTNVSSEEYGEGSFTKGIYVTIPFDLMLLHPTTAKGSIGWVPLTRDGGQMLSRKTSLYTLTSL